MPKIIRQETRKDGIYTVTYTETSAELMPTNSALQEIIDSSLPSSLSDQDRQDATTQILLRIEAEGLQVTEQESTKL